MILNLTQHKATPEQKAAGVWDFPDSVRGTLTDLLTFNGIPTKESMHGRAEAIYQFAKMHEPISSSGAVNLCQTVMIGGAPFFMSTLESVLIAHGWKPCYAFSKRVVTEQKQEDGSVVKVSSFKHEGFFEV